MRVTLWEPSGELTPNLLHDTLLLVSVDVPASSIDVWTRLERLIAYDWAWRVHRSASDNPVKQRDKPSFVTNAES